MSLMLTAVMILKMYTGPVEVYEVLKCRNV